MKRRLYLLLVILFFFLMLCFPRPVFDGASEGLLLWFNVVLPTLLPFIILTNLLMETRAIDLIARVITPVICPLFRVSSSGSFAVLSGFLCGYPMGSKVTADLVRSGRISASEGQYLLSFCNNTSPMFIISFILMQNLKSDGLLFPAMVILFGSPVICSFLFRRKYIAACGFSHNSYSEAPNQNYLYFSQAPSSKINLSTHSKHSPGSSLLDFCIMNGFETITKIGGYIMLFSISTELLLVLTDTLVNTVSPILLPAVSHKIISAIRIFLLPSLEITNGITSICQSSFPESVHFLLCMALTSFGGWCSVAQTGCMLQGTDLKLRPYIKEKLVTALVTSLLACLYLFFSHR